MRTQPIRIDGYSSGVTDFATVLLDAPADEQVLVQQLVDRLAQHVADPDNSGFTSVTIIGHSDRQDNAAMSCDQRRQSEADAAKDRALSAWQWTKDQVSERFVAAGQPAPPDEWWETNPAMTWALVFAGAGQLLHPNPTMEQRPLNRRVNFLIAMRDG